MKLSAVIITYNEELNIARCIDSLSGIVDEIVVLDSFSTDETKSICEERNVRFYQRKWEGYAATKNYANSLSSNSYVLSVDADEQVSEELKASLLELKKEDLKGVYSFNRRTNYCGKWIRFLGWYPDKKVRIFPKDTTSWSGEYVHEELTFKELLPEHFLKGDLNHYSYYDRQDHRRRADNYSVLTAKKLYAKGKRVSIIRPFLSAIGRFLAMYIIKLGFMEGITGWHISKISAESNYVKYKELLKLQREGDREN